MILCNLDPHFCGASRQTYQRSVQLCTGKKASKIPGVFRLRKLRNSHICLCRIPTQHTRSDKESKIVSLRDCVGVVSQVIATETNQPNFAVENLGRIPTSWDNQPEIVWVTKSGENLGLEPGQKVPMEEFWRVPSSQMRKIWQGLTPEEYIRLPVNMYWKAQRANLDEVATLTMGMALERLHRNGWRLDLGSNEIVEVPVSQLVVLHVPRPLRQGSLSNPLLLQGTASQTRLLRTELQPEFADKLGCRAAWHRTLLIPRRHQDPTLGISSRFLEVDLTSAAFDVHSYNKEGVPGFVQELDGEEVDGWASPFKQFSEQKPGVDFFNEAKRMVDVAFTMLTCFK